ncbi:hypothetical protein [Chryseobacterium potabilaquae]|uniref:Uncharacterized protein n=1 Tax=Chryseobacterium potabilaquae TaxID=2675057 RepID=A0A6N4XDP4_9FLAO|nr:hypothetical protein [Chryseobacterium potabilaquae]CAA7196710.1 hypothetical protein CHRY9293_02785 [Chryseobacterium potabilaquae]
MNGLIVIEGNENIMNSGNILGSIVKVNQVHNTNVVIDIKTMEGKIIERINESVDFINNMSKSHITLSKLIQKQVENDNQHYDVILHLAQAAENNSKANLIMAESIKKDKELIERFIDIIEFNPKL